MAHAGGLGIHQALAILRGVDAINSWRRQCMVDLVREQCVAILAGKRIAFWGAAYKPNADDIRGSPAIARKLHALAATAHIRRAKDNSRYLE